MKIRGVIEKLYKKVKRDENYSIPSWLPTEALLGELWHRSRMTIRGLLKRNRFKRVDGMLFIGERVRFRSPKTISIGRSASFHHDVTIDALSKEGIQIGNNFTLREYSIIECTGVIRAPGEGLIIGDNVGISQNAFIGVRGKVSIGNNVIMGPYVVIYAANHNFDDPNSLIIEQGENRKGITIEDDCWLGARSVVLDGVTVGKGSVVAAGCVVTKDVPPYSVVGGVPGKIIKKRIPANQE